MMLQIVAVVGAAWLLLWCVCVCVCAVCGVRVRVCLFPLDPSRYYRVDELVVDPVS